MNKCPHCAMEIHADAIICPYCKEEITPKTARVTVMFSDNTGLVQNLGVYVDGHKVGEVGLLKTIEFDVEPGEHVFFVKEDFSESPRKSFHLDSGETLNLRIKSKGTSGIGSMYYMFFNPKNHFILEKFDNNNS